MTQQQRETLSRYYFRLAMHKRGVHFPDGRSDEQKALGMELDWRRRVLLNQRQRADRAFWRKVHEARQRFFSEPLPNNVTRLHR